MLDHMFHSVRKTPNLSGKTLGLTLGQVKQARSQRFVRAALVNFILIFKFNL